LRAYQRKVIFLRSVTILQELIKSTGSNKLDLDKEPNVESFTINYRLIKEGQIETKKIN
jgi:hypothetical protein